MKNTLTPLKTILLLSIMSTLIFVTVANAENVNSSEKFVVAFIDKSARLEWSRALNYEYKNGCGNFENDGVFTCSADQSSSEASIACRNIGARLPTKAEYISMILNFDHRYSHDHHLEVTKIGAEKMDSVFQDGKNLGNYIFWSSDLMDPREGDEANWSSAYAFRAGGGMDLIGRIIPANVRCARTLKF